MVTSGPGVTNAITPLADAFYHSIPLILVTGQISTMDLSSRKRVRQRGFQEVPTLDLVKKISKDSFFVKNSILFEQKIQNLLNFSTFRRPGPVVIDFPMNVQRSIIVKLKNKLKQKKK